VKAGRELDLLVADKVMDLNIWRDGRMIYYKTEGMAYNRVPFYSKKIAAAWLVVEALNRRGLLIDLASSTDGKTWVCTFEDDDQQYEATADTAPLAICLSAIRILRRRP
jgi:hypothetical protein